MPESRTDLLKGIKRKGLSVPPSGPLQVPPTTGSRRVSQSLEVGVSLALGFGYKVPA